MSLPKITFKYDDIVFDETLLDGFFKMNRDIAGNFPEIPFSGIFEIPTSGEKTTMIGNSPVFCMIGISDDEKMHFPVISRSYFNDRSYLEFQIIVCDSEPPALTYLVLEKENLPHIELYKDGSILHLNIIRREEISRYKIRIDELRENFASYVFKNFVAISKGTKMNLEVEQQKIVFRVLSINKGAINFAKLEGRFDVMLVLGRSGSPVDLENIERPKQSEFRQFENSEIMGSAPAPAPAPAPAHAHAPTPGFEKFKFDPQAPNKYAQYKPPKLPELPAQYALPPTPSVPASRILHIDDHVVTNFDEAVGELNKGNKLISEKLLTAINKQCNVIITDIDKGTGTYYKLFEFTKDDPRRTSNDVIIKSEKLCKTLGIIREHFGYIIQNSQPTSGGSKKYKDKYIKYKMKYNELKKLKKT